MIMKILFIFQNLIILLFIHNLIILVIILKFKILISINFYNKNVQECNLYYKHIIIIVKKSNRIISTQILIKSFLQKQFNLTNFIENVSNNSLKPENKKD